MTQQTPVELQQRFGSKLVSFDRGAGGLTRLRVSTPAASAELYLHGAHVTAWQPAGHQPVLWMSAKSWFEPGKPLRGGVPICFPWFGPHPSDPAAPGHGTVRLQEWKLSAVNDRRRGVELVLRHGWSELDRQYFPHPLDLEYTVTVGSTLTLELAVTNPADAPVRFSEALHTYFAVADVRNIRILGLEHTDFLDKVAAGARTSEGPSPILITAQTDRVYLDTSATCWLEDPAGDSPATATVGTPGATGVTTPPQGGGLTGASAPAPGAPAPGATPACPAGGAVGRGRRVIIEKSGSATTVVWNPWIAKAAAMPDFGDDEWPGMICIETANALDNAVLLQPRQTHRMAARIGVEGM